MSRDTNTNTDTDGTVGPAFRVWMCGRLGCVTELEPLGPGERSCPACGEVYDAETGTHLPDRHPDRDESGAAAGQSWGETDGDR